MVKPDFKNVLDSIELLLGSIFYTAHPFVKKLTTLKTSGEKVLLTMQHFFSRNSKLRNGMASSIKPLLVESSVIVVFYVIFLMPDAVIINYFEKKFFQWRENGTNNCFKPLISSVFTTVATRLKSEQKETEK